MQAAAAGPACAGGNYAGTEEGVEILRAAVSAAARQTLPAVDLARTEVLAPGERDRHPPVQAPEWGQRPRRLDGLDEQPVKRRRCSPVQHQTDVVVARDRRDAEQGFAVRPAISLRQRTLMRQERRASHEDG